MDEKQLKQWQELILEIAGLHIPREKAYLFQNRLRPIMLKKNLTLSQIYASILEAPEGDTALQVIDLMTTHETSFFRDDHPFKLFAYLVSELIASKRIGKSREITILSAGCSTGEEPYSIAMIMEELLQCHTSIRYRIDACDVAMPTILRAREGVYKNVDRVTAKRLEMFFQPHSSGWQVKECIRKKIQFEKRNLLDLEDLGQAYNFIFCRNVAIYFQPEVRGLLYEQLSDHLKPDGVLIVGSSESLSGFRLLKRYEGPDGFYYKPLMAESVGGRGPK